MNARAPPTIAAANGMLRYRQACPWREESPPGAWVGVRFQRLCDADVEDLVGLEGLVAAVADDAAHHRRGQHLRQPDAGGGAAGVVPAANQPHGFAGERLGEPSVVFTRPTSVQSDRRAGDLSAAEGRLP